MVTRVKYIIAYIILFSACLWKFNSGLTDMTSEILYCLGIVSIGGAVILIAPIKNDLLCCRIMIALEVIWLMRRIIKEQSALALFSTIILYSVILMLAYMIYANINCFVILGQVKYPTLVCLQKYEEEISGFEMANQTYNDLIDQMRKQEIDIGLQKSWIDNLKEKFMDEHIEPIKSLRRKMPETDLSGIVGLNAMFSASRHRLQKQVKKWEDYSRWLYLNQSMLRVRNKQVIEKNEHMAKLFNETERMINAADYPEKIQAEKRRTALEIRQIIKKQSKGESKVRRKL